MKYTALVVTVWVSVLSPELFADWLFSQPIAVTGKAVNGIYHHLEGAGRKHIATSGNRIAVAWEDDSSGDPQIYLALKNRDDPVFDPAIKVSNGDEAYEPAIASLTDGRFVLVWEQDGYIYASTFSGQSLSKPLKISAKSLSGHSSVATYNDQIYVVWREQQDETWSLQVARLATTQTQDIELLSIRPVEAKPVNTPILFPALATNNKGLYVAWEDRTAGHTRLKFSFSADQAKSFIKPQYLNEFYSNRTEYDKGNGVTRVSIASFGEDEIVAAWMDKRRRGGYGIFASIGSDGAFGPNEKIHGPKGDKLPHSNPATSGNINDETVVVWDDYRDGDSDIWLTSIDDDGEWGEDFSPAIAAGAGEQSHASVALDETGGLHLIWIERDNPLAPTRLWYSHGN